MIRMQTIPVSAPRFFRFACQAKQVNGLYACDIFYRTSTGQQVSVAWQDDVEETAVPSTIVELFTKANDIPVPSSTEEL